MRAIHGKHQCVDHCHMVLYDAGMVDGTGSTNSTIMYAWYTAV